jgi:hypothetical protein
VSTILEAVQAVNDPDSALGAALWAEWHATQRYVVQQLEGMLLYPRWMHTKRGRRQLRRRARRAKRGKL